jgi:carboxyl-terminal processing protease
LEGSLKGLFETLDDPHSRFLTSEELKKINDDTSGEFGGIGIYIWKTENGVEVARPILGTPADKAGIMAGDIITAVGGESIQDFEIDDVVNLIRGDPATEVTVTIQRGTQHSFEITIQREMIEVTSVRSAVIPGGIGYLLIRKFTSKTLERVTEALADFQKENYNSLILDLRSNPGGLLSSVTQVADLFFDRGSIIVSTQSRRAGESRVYQAESRAIVPLDFPIVVLIDRYSASAAEILTGALKDSKRAYILGETSFGKGSVQQIIPLEEGGFKLTTAKYFTPSGESIDSIGIEPETVIERPVYTAEEEESYSRLVDGGYVKEFVKEHRAPTKQEIDSFIQFLASAGISPRRERVEKDIRDEVNRLNNVEPVYDLEYDRVLREAVHILSTNEVLSTN